MFLGLVDGSTCEKMRKMVNFGQKWVKMPYFSLCSIGVILKISSAVLNGVLILARVSAPKSYLFRAKSSQKIFQKIHTSYLWHLKIGHFLKEFAYKSPCGSPKKWWSAGRKMNFSKFSKPSAECHIVPKTLSNEYRMTLRVVFYIWKIAFFDNQVVLSLRRWLNMNYQ